MQSLEHAKSLWRSQKNGTKIGLGALALITLTMTAYVIGGSSGVSFQANLVGGAPKPFDGAMYPLQDTLNWVKLSSSEYSGFKSGTLTYDLAKTAGKVIPLPKYDATILKNDPASLGWQGADLDKRNVLLSYVTAYMGAYTSGSKAAIEQAGSHVGIDIRAARGTPVFAIANGKVVKSKEDASSGKVVVVEHPNVPSLENPGTLTTYYSSYLHLDSILVSDGQILDKGAQIGTVGTTGTSTTYHLHFQLDNKSAPFHPYWPFTFSEASKAGLDFFTGVNQGLGREKGNEFTVHAFDWINANIGGATQVPTETVVTPPVTAPVVNQNTNTVPATNNNVVAPVSNTIVKFALTYPTRVVVGQPVDVTLRALDANGNLSGTGLLEPITLAAEGGSGSLSPSVIIPSAISTGEVKVQFTAQAAGSLAIVARSGIASGSGPVLTAEAAAAVTTTTTTTTTTIPVTPVASETNTPIATTPSTNTSTSVAPSSIAFADVSSTSSYARAISYLQNKNVIAGYPDGTFKPNQTINRAEVTKVILGGSSIDPLPTVSRTTFPDVFSDDWFAGWVERAKELEIVNGNPDGTFTPSTTVNTASALKILLLTNQADLGNVIVLSDPFVDVSAGDWFAIYFQYAKDKNLIEADAAGKVYPAAGMSRAQVAEMMYRLIRIKETGAAKYSSALDL